MQTETHREPPRSGALFSEQERAVLVAMAAAAMPARGGLEGGGAPTVVRLLHFLRDMPREFAEGLRALVWMVELAPLATRGRRFSSLSRDDAESFLDAWVNGRLHLQRSALRALLTPLKYAHFDAPHMFEHVGCRYKVDPVKDEQPRWWTQVTDGRTEGDARDATMELEVDVVVIGTGAGGAAAAYALARKGHAVLMLEEGDYHRRSSFTGRAPDMTKLLYRDHGITVALGNAGIPVFAGRAVGGTTLVNSGTCYRVPEPIFTRWRERYGLDSTSANMDPYYAEVEAMLGVEQAPFALTGGVGRVIERGARSLGMLHHGPLRRNAPGCDGQGICCFGCPTAAKRSTDVSYVPAALERGAQLITAAKVDLVEIVAGRARGVRATLGSGRKLRVKAAAVVVAGGTLCTPGLLHRSGLTHPMIGKNLSIHPATKVCALFDETIDPSRGIPQGYCVEDLAEEGIMLEGGSTPLDVMSMGVPFVGGRYMDIMADYMQLATFGLMVRDTARGAVRMVGKRLLITYDMNADDLERMRKGIVKLCELFRAAGARRVLPFVAGRHEIRSQADLDALATRPLRAGDVEITAYHPLGTARVGTDPKRSVCGPDHETHECAGLYVMDGSAIPSSLGVNPQMTIMAMALRASEQLSSTL